LHGADQPLALSDSPRLQRGLPQFTFGEAAYGLKIALRGNASRLHRFLRTRRRSHAAQAIPETSGG
jgi:hypothetical protein